MHMHNMCDIMITIIAMITTMTLIMLMLILIILNTKKIRSARRMEPFRSTRSAFKSSKSLYTYMYLYVIYIYIYTYISVMLSCLLCVSCTQGALLVLDFSSRPWGFELLHACISSEQALDKSDAR